jgi:hypothetical protein
MFYQLPNGKVLEMSIEQYLSMSDEELEYLVAYNYGEYVENPWFGSILNKRDKIHDDSLEDNIPDLTTTPETEKLLDLDIDFDIED